MKPRILLLLLQIILMLFVCYNNNNNIFQLVSATEHTISCFDDPNFVIKNLEIPTHDRVQIYAGNCTVTVLGSTFNPLINSIKQFRISDSINSNFYINDLHCVHGDQLPRVPCLKLGGLRDCGNIWIKNISADFGTILNENYGVAYLVSHDGDLHNVTGKYVLEDLYTKVAFSGGIVKAVLHGVVFDGDIEYVRSLTIRNVVIDQQSSNYELENQQSAKLNGVIFSENGRIQYCGEILIDGVIIRNPRLRSEVEGKTELFGVFVHRDVFSVDVAFIIKNVWLQNPIMTTNGGSVLCVGVSFGFGKSGSTANRGMSLVKVLRIENIFIDRIHAEVTGTETTLTGERSLWVKAVVLGSFILETDLILITNVTQLVQKATNSRCGELILMAVDSRAGFRKVKNFTVSFCTHVLLTGKIEDYASTSNPPVTRCKNDGDDNPLIDAGLINIDNDRAFQHPSLSDNISLNFFHLHLEVAISCALNYANSRVIFITPNITGIFSIRIKNLYFKGKVFALYNDGKQRISASSKMRIMDVAGEIVEGIANGVELENAIVETEQASGADECVFYALLFLRGMKNVSHVYVKNVSVTSTGKVSSLLSVRFAINLISISQQTSVDVGKIIVLDSSIRMHDSEGFQLLPGIVVFTATVIDEIARDVKSITLENSAVIIERCTGSVTSAAALFFCAKATRIGRITVINVNSTARNVRVFLPADAEVRQLLQFARPKGQTFSSLVCIVGFSDFLDINIFGQQMLAFNGIVQGPTVEIVARNCHSSSNMDGSTYVNTVILHFGSTVDGVQKVSVVDSSVTGTFPRRFSGQDATISTFGNWIGFLQFCYGVKNVGEISVLKSTMKLIGELGYRANVTAAAIIAGALKWRPVPSEYLSPSKNGIGSMLIRNIDIYVQRKFSSSSGSTSSDSENNNNNNNFAVAALDLSFPLLPQSQAVQISDVYIFDQTTTATGSRSSCTASSCSLLRLGDGLALSEGAFRISSSRFSFSGSLVAAFESSFASSSASSSSVSFTFDGIFIASPSSSLSSAPVVDTAIYSRLIYTSSNDVSQFGNQQQQILRLHDLHQTSWNFECTRPWKSRLISTFKNLASETAKINFPCFLSRTASPNKTLSKSLAVTETVSVSPLFVVPFVSPLRKTAKTTSDVNSAFSFAAAAAAATAARNRYIVASMSRYGEGECGSRQDVDDVPEIATSPLQIRISGKASWAGGTMIGNLVFCFLLLFVFFLGFVVYWKFLKKHSSSSSSAADGEGEENMEYDRFGREISPPAPPLPPFEIIVIQSKMGQGIIFVTTMLLEPTLSAALALITLPEIPVMWRLFAAVVVGLILFLLVRSSYRYLYQRNIVEVFKKPDARQVAKWQNKDEEAGVVVGFLRKQFRCWLVAEGEWEIDDDDNNDVGNEDARNNSSSSRNTDNNNNSNRNNNNRRNKKKRRREVSDADRLAFLLALPALEGFTDRAPRFLVLDTAVLLAFVVASFLGNVIGGSKGCVATAVVLLIALILHFACTLYLRPNVERVNRYGIPLVSIAHISCVIALMAGVSEKDVGALLAAVSFLTLPLMILTFIAGCLAPIVGAALRMSRGKRRHVTSSSSRNDNSRSGLFSSLMDDDDQDEEDQDPRNFSMRARRDERRRKEERENRNNNNNNNGDVELESRRRFSNYNERNSSSSSAQQHRFFHHQQQQQHHQLDDDLLRPQRVKIERQQQQRQQKPQQEDSLSSRRLDSASQIMARFKEIQQQQQQQSRSSSPRNNRNQQHPQIPNRSTSPSSSSRSQSRSQRVDTTSSNDNNNNNYYRRNNYHDSDQDDNDLHILDSRYNSHQHQRSNRSSSTRRNDDFSSSPSASASASYSSNSNRQRHQHQPDYSHRKEEEEERSSPRSQSRSRSNGASAVTGRSSSSINKNQNREQRSSSTSRGRR